MIDVNKKQVLHPNITYTLIIIFNCISRKRNKAKPEHKRYFDLQTLKKNSLS